MNKRQPLQMRLERVLSRSLEEYEELSEAKCLMVAVSGGLDSMVLLHFLRSTRKVHQKSILALHFNHQLRGSASEADACWVENQCREYKVDFVTDSGDVQSRVRETGESIEMAARHLRYRFFSNQAQLHSSPVLALAHHADDQLELILMRIMRGSGPEGLSGMPLFQDSTPDRILKLWRPFLEFNREEITEYALEHQIDWREDYSNSDLHHERNRVRHLLIPNLIDQFGQRVKSGVIRSAELIEAEHDFLVKEADKLEFRNDSSFDFTKLHKGVQRELMRRAIIRIGVTPEFEWIERLRLAPAGTIEMLPSGCGVKVKDRFPWLEKVNEKPVVEFQSSFLEILLDTSSGYLNFSQHCLEWQIKEGGLKCFTKQSKNTVDEIFDADKVGNKVLLRHWRAGDRIQPIGSKGSIKLQDWFTNAKINVEQRRKLIVAEAPNRGVFWVQGMRIAEAFKVTPQTQRLLHWKCQPLSSL